MSESIIEVLHPTDRPNFSVVYLPWVWVAFSYRTPIGINRLDGWGWTVRVNEWGPTTGKHINYLIGDYDEKDQRRLDAPQFEALLEEVIKP